MSDSSGEEEISQDLQSYIYSKEKGETGKSLSIGEMIKPKQEKKQKKEKQEKPKDVKVQTITLYQELQDINYKYQKNVEWTSKEYFPIKLTLKFPREIEKGYPKVPVKFTISSQVEIPKEQLDLFTSQMNEKNQGLLNHSGCVKTLVFYFEEILDEYNSKIDESLSCEEKTSDERTPLPDSYSQNVNFSPKIVEVSNFNYELIRKTNFNFDREKIGLTHTDENIWIYGGSSDKEEYNDLYSYNFKERKWYSYSFNGDKVEPPKCKDPYIFIMNDTLYLYSGTDELHYVENIDADDKVWKKISLNKPEDYLQLQNNTPILYNDKLVIYSGSFKKKAENNMTQITFSKKNGKIESLKMTDSLIPRYDYAVIEFKKMLYYYGGRDNNIIYDDLFTIDYHYAVNPINTQGISPNALHSAILFKDANEENLYLFGGVSYSGVQSNLYRLDLQNKRWDIIQVTGAPNPSIPFGESYEIPRASCSSCLIRSSLFIIGGYKSIEKKKEYCGTPVFLHMDLGLINDDSVSEFLSSLYKKTKEKEECDFKITCDDNGKFVEIYAHKCVLAVRCPFFKEIVEKKDEIIFEKYSPTVIENYLNFLYTGSIKIDGKTNVESLVEFSLFSPQNNEVIRKILSQNSIYLSSYEYILETIKNDFYSLITKKYFSDLKIEIYENETQELIETFDVHKCFILRLPYFHSMMDSGMHESQSSIIQFTDLPVESFKTILIYLYRGEISVDMTNAVEMYITSKLFQIDEITKYSRKIISKSIDPDSIWDIVSLAEIYEDQYMTKSISKYVLNNFEHFEDDFQKFPIPIKMTVMETLNRIQKSKEKKIKKMAFEQILQQKLHFSSSMTLRAQKEIKKNIVKELKKELKM